MSFQSNSTHSFNRRSNDSGGLVYLVSMGLVFLTLVMASLTAKSQESPRCVFDHKDYDSPGFSLPVHKGFFTKGRFGCVYVCDCGDIQVKATHVLVESHFELEFGSSDTGGPKRAKWFICPFSVKPESWTPKYNEYGQIMYYDAEIETRSFDAARSKLSGLQGVCKAR